MNKFHLDGSEISWLVYADWLEDQGINAQHIRQCNCDVNDFYDLVVVQIPMNQNFWEQRNGIRIPSRVGSISTPSVGTFCEDVGVRWWENMVGPLSIFNDVGSTV